MVFSSQAFVFHFLPAVLAVYYLAFRAGPRARLLVLSVASYAFYAWWRADFVVLMLASTLIDHVCGKRVHSAPPGRRKRWVVLSAATNLGLLAYFKYAGFGVDNLNAILEGAGMEPLTWAPVVLPVGISFYTFQSMSYTIDIYRRQAQPARSILDLITYVSLFPQLVAGPIVRYRDLQHQLRERRHSLDAMGRGARLLMIGMCKKVIIADGLAEIPDEVFARSDPGFAQSWLGALGYGLQLYFDFSAYSDMAIGLGLLFGFRFPCNFYSPYKAASVSEFWRRWHISLSAWLRDYLYVPLGGNRRGPARNAFNLAVTMLLGGLWHGAAWTFVLWGAWHGILLVAERAVGRLGLPAWPRALAVARTFVLVLFGWVLFRAPDTGSAVSVAEGMLGLNGGGDLMDGYWTMRPKTWFLLAAGTVLVFFSRNSWQQAVERDSRPWDAWVVPLFACALIMLYTAEHVPFLYYRF